jgi:mono/diheme cytochrome c family protein
VNSAPPVTAAFVRAGVREKADAHTLEEGRKVFLNRCIACHALPDIRHYDSGRIPRIVGWMGPRANLNAEQHQALLKYLLTVKATAASE